MARAIAFLKAILVYYRCLGMTVRRVTTDDGSLLQRLDLKHICTRPQSPKTSGKAERFIDTALRAWSYTLAYPNSDRRADQLLVRLHRYNWYREGLFVAACAAGDAAAARRVKARRPDLPGSLSENQLRLLPELAESGCAEAQDNGRARLADRRSRRRLERQRAEPRRFSR